ncbi:S8 family serine peptidase [Vitiosangium sp. GDMCC 1.1324]|uniref:S8 family serine peptidase n=1 Tax=Vitiosangium sp. (strain GDMCC 1.1324) TaxID=2138576 RepID=UPI00130DAAEF|nr:S8 family serine peptidase [Vitiosangium sp. GDMCC 1.1324]
MDWQQRMKVAEARELVKAYYLGSEQNGYRYTEPPPVTVAILDDGCDDDHPNLRSVIKASHSFLTKSKAVKNKGSSHGTLSAGLVGGIAEGGFLGGVAQPDSGINTSLIVAQYHPDSADDQKMFTTLCEMGARVISCSWGYGPGYFRANKGAAQKALKLQRLLRELSENLGVVFVFSSGNEGKELAPKDVLFAESAILVSATLNLEDAPEVKSGPCSYGAGITVCAPGSDDSGLRPISTCNQGAGDESLGSPHFDYHGNTSAACPMVAGVAALVIAANPALSAMEVKTILCETADVIDPDCEHNKGEWTVARAALSQGQLGSVDRRVWGAAYSRWYGFGRVNAEAAVQKALSLRT